MRNVKNLTTHYQWHFRHRYRPLPPPPPPWISQAEVVSRINAIREIEGVDRLPDGPYWGAASGPISAWSGRRH